MYDNTTAGVSPGGHSGLSDSQPGEVFPGPQRDLRHAGGGRDGDGAAVSDQHQAGV